MLKYLSAAVVFRECKGEIESIIGLLFGEIVAITPDNYYIYFQFIHDYISL